jgi:hypothetical protein
MTSTVALSAGGATADGIKKESIIFTAVAPLKKAERPL